MWTFLVTPDTAMPILAYVAIIVVGFSSILLELNWLTSAPPQPKPAIQAAATAPTTQAVSGGQGPRMPHPSSRRRPAAPKPPTDGPNKVLSPVYPTTAGAPKFDAADNAPKPAEPAPAPAQPPAQMAAMTPPPIAPGLAQRGAGRQQSDHRAGDGYAEPRRGIPGSPVMPPTPKRRRPKRRASSPRPMPTRTAPTRPRAIAAIAPSPVAAKAAAQACNIRACADAYQSFRESDCTYQPGNGGSRRQCQMSPDSSRRVEAKRRLRVEPDADDLRGAEAAVRRLESESRGRSYRAESRALPADLDPQAIDDDSVVVIRRGRGGWR